MSLMDKIKAFFSGAAAGETDRGHTHAAGETHDDELGGTYLQTPTDPDVPLHEPTPEEFAAAAQAEPPTTTVEGLSEDEPRTEPRDEVH